MRDYAKVSPLFWTRGSGKRLRGDADAQVLALYLVTCPNANMVGIYYVPFVAIAHETGLGAERAEAALSRIATSGFAFYDPENELAWVPNMASYQIGDELKEGDKRRGGAIRAELEKIGRHPYVRAFWNTYGAGYGLGACPLDESRDVPSAPPAGEPHVPASHPDATTTPVAGASPPLAEGASADETLSPKPLQPQSTRAGSGAGEEQDSIAAKAAPVLVPVEAPPKGAGSKPGKVAARATRLDPAWRPSPTLVERFRAKRIDALGSFERFQSWALSASGPAASKVDWDQAFNGWVLREIGEGKATALGELDALPIFRLPNREALIPAADDAPDFTGFSLGATK